MPTTIYIYIYLFAYKILHRNKSLFLSEDCILIIRPLSGVVVLADGNWRTVYRWRLIVDPAICPTSCPFDFLSAGLCLSDSPSVPGPHVQLRVGEPQGCCTTGGAALWRSVSHTSILLASLHSWLYVCPTAVLAHAVEVTPPTPSVSLLRNVLWLTLFSGGIWVSPWRYFLSHQGLGKVMIEKITIMLLWKIVSTAYWKLINIVMFSDSFTFSVYIFLFLLLFL